MKKKKMRALLKQSEQWIPHRVAISSFLLRYDSSEWFPFPFDLGHKVNRLWSIATKLFHIAHQKFTQYETASQFQNRKITTVY